jgi:trans-L-3-hydroxyproline dehydratase
MFVAGKYVSTRFIGVPSFVLASDQEAVVEGIGTIRYDLAYGGAFYAYVAVDQLNLDIIPENTDRFIELGRAIKHYLIGSGLKTDHPFEEDLSFLYGVIFTGTPHNSKNYTRNVCVFADGEVDRSPTGSGVSGRLAIMNHKGIAKPDSTYTFESILGTVFKGHIQEVSTFGEYQSVRPVISGDAFITGEHQFFIDKNDPLRTGFLLR